MTRVVMKTGRIDNAIRALTQVDDLKKGCATVLTLAVQQVLSRHTRESLQERSSLDEELAAAYPGVASGSLL